METVVMGPIRKLVMRKVMMGPITDNRSQGRDGTCYHPVPRSGDRAGIRVLNQSGCNDIVIGRLCTRTGYRQDKNYTA